MQRNPIESLSSSFDPSAIALDDYFLLEADAGRDGFS